MRVWSPVGCGLGVLALTLAVETSWGPLARLDKSINTHWYAFGLEHAGWVEFWKVITDGGGTLFALALWLVIGVVLIRRHRVRDALAITVAIAASQLVFRILRLAVDRPRPPAGFVHVDTPSFPSAHTMAASTGALLFAALLWPTARTLFRRVVVLTVMIAWAALVGVSRVFLCVHWPSDVLAGWLCAVALVVPAYALALRHLPRGPADRPRTPSGGVDVNRLASDRHRETKTVLQATFPLRTPISSDARPHDLDSGCRRCIRAPPRRRFAPNSTIISHDQFG